MIAIIGQTRRQGDRETRRQILRVLCVLCGSIPLLVGGCSKKHNYDPRDNGSTMFPDGRLGVMVDAPHNAMADQPKITKARFRVDGQEVAIPNTIAVSTKKTGHCEYISFTAPKDAREIQLDLTILHDRKIYKMIVPFVKEDKAGVAWKRAIATVVLEGKAHETGFGPRLQASGKANAAVLPEARSRRPEAFFSVASVVQLLFLFFSKADKGLHVAVAGRISFFLVRLWKGGCFAAAWLSQPRFAGSHSPWGWATRAGKS